MICEPWITEPDLVACNCDATAVDPDRLNDLMWSASELMFLLSGQVYAGVCTETLRPDLGCEHQPLELGAGVWDGVWDEVTMPPASCAAQGFLLPVDYPISATVKMDGATVTDFRLDGRTLWREAGWPCHQNLAAADTEHGTWSVTVTHGISPPTSGRMAAAALCAELVRACVGDKGCRLPFGTVSQVRAGTSLDFAEFAALVRSGAVGIAEVDLFLGAVNPSGLRRRGRFVAPGL